jgi:hypothetical protein
MSAFAILYFARQQRPRVFAIREWLATPVDAFDQWTADRTEEKALDRWRLNRSSV